jgi:hypothetical protein
LLLPLRSPNDLAGYVVTIIEIADTRKCRLAFDSIAPRYARSRVPEHVSDVGGKRRIGVDTVPDLASRDAEPHRQSKILTSSWPACPTKWAPRIRSVA